MSDDIYPATARRRIGTLGSAFTFAGQATAELVSRGEEWTAPSYFPTMDAVVEAVLDGTIEAGVLTSETSRTVCTDTVARMLAGDRLHVVDEIVVPYRCALLVKPGTALADIRHVGGHGSIRQCATFLREHLPHATAAMHEQNSVVAAHEVLASDGTTAVIATEALATEIGLEILEREVDGGASGGWWALTAKPEPRLGATHVAVRAEGSAALDATWRTLAEHGLVVRTTTNQPTGELFRYRYLVTAHTVDGTPVTDAAVEALGPDLIGSFTSTVLT